MFMYGWKKKKKNPLHLSADNDECAVLLGLLVLNLLEEVVGFQFQQILD